MSEKMTPSGKPYNGPKYNLNGDTPEKIAERVEKMNAQQVSQGLSQYKGIIPGKDAAKNTYEMMALYQHAMNQLEGGEEVWVDGRFGPDTHAALKAMQNELGFDPKDCDGLPGPKTTEALIKALNSKVTAAPNAPTPAPAAPNAPTPAPAAPNAPTPAPAAPNAPTPAPRLEFSTENSSVKIILENAKKPSVMSALSVNGSLYNGTTPLAIDYAVVKQSDGEFYIYDKPLNMQRRVYRTDSNMSVVGVLEINAANQQRIVKGGAFAAVYMPTPKIQ